MKNLLLLCTLLISFNSFANDFLDAVAAYACAVNVRINFVTLLMLISNSE
jgi:hypothetical protein